ncbi:hypothetical protein [uncultured Microbacterium sp.]|uniref:hypothetical protein n=1 Tax=uncultured Microbacterium sp. TaxID=191216 RepID=UPI002603E467|nr:hypothetical protein [uncultured Microbacterium sp.]
MGVFHRAPPRVSSSTVEETVDEMSSFGEKLAAAREARPSKDVQVVLDGEIASQRDALIEQIESIQEDDRLGVESEADNLRTQLDELAEAARESMITLRFTRLPGRDWAALTSKHPVRPDVPIDRHYGYNYDAVCEAAAAVSGVRVEDGAEIALVVRDATADSPAVNEWADLFDVLSGTEVADIRDAVWALNEWEPQQRLNLLVKDSGAAMRSDKK